LNFKFQIPNSKNQINGAELKIRIAKAAKFDYFVSAFMIYLEFGFLLSGS